MPPDVLLEGLDPAGPPEVVWSRPVVGPQVTVLLGAFDPPTNAHLDLMRATGEPAAFGLTKVLLARQTDALFSMEQRARVLYSIAERCGHGLLFSNRGTYLEVGRALRSQGLEPTFIIGADKLDQLADPSFYEDGERGVEATFAEFDLVVVPRAGSPITRSDVRVLDPGDVFTDPKTAHTSATEIRRRIRAREVSAGWVPPEVDELMWGYTSGG